MLEHFDALLTKFNIFLDLADADIKPLIQLFDLLLLLPSLLLKLLSSLLNLLDPLLIDLLIRSMLGLHWNFRDLSPVINMVSDILEPESSLLLFFLRSVVYLSLDVSTHGLKISQIYQINQSNEFIMILPSYAMIKVHSVFPNEWPRREIAIQTEMPLPRIRLSHQKNKLKVMRQEHHLAFCGAEGMKESGLSCQIDTVMRATSYVAIKGQNHVLKELKDRKQNSCASLQASKLQAKSFRFLTFEENLLKSAILKHLEGRVLSRNERKKMDQTITISFVTKQTRKDRFRGMFQPDDFDIIEVPQHEEVSASIMDVVNGIRSVYSKLHLHCQEKDLLMGNTNRRILHTVQSIICKGQNQQIFEPSITSWEKENVLSNYLFKYVKKTEFKEGFSNSEDNKKQLMNFYQEIYNRYEATPFNQYIQEEETPLPKENLFNAKLSKPRVSKQPFCTTDESFIKLRFYNNLRKEVKTLGQDAEKIISQQINKFNKF